MSMASCRLYSKVGAGFTQLSGLEEKLRLGEKLGLGENICFQSLQEKREVKVIDCCSLLGVL